MALLQKKDGPALDLSTSASDGVEAGATAAAHLLATGPCVGSDPAALPIGKGDSRGWPRDPGRSKGRGWMMRRALAAGDVLALSIAFVLAFLPFHGRLIEGALSWGGEILLFLGSLPLWVLLAKLHGLYDSDEEHADYSTTDDIVGVFHVVTIGAWLFFVVASLTNAVDVNVTRLTMFWIGATLLVTTARATARAVVRRSRAFVQNTVIVGAGTVGQLLARKISQHPEYGLRIVGFVDGNPRAALEDGPGLTLLGRPEDLVHVVRRHRIDRVIFSFSQDTHAQTLELIRSLDGMYVRVDIVPRLFEVLGTQVGVHTIEGVPLFVLPSGRLARSSLALKRAFDIVFSLVALISLAPVLVLLMAAIKFDSPGPVIFRQTRMGAGDKTFRIFKFRTMRADADTFKAQVAHLNKHRNGDSRMFKVPGDPRVTRVGAYLRRFSLDELPQLINVLRGEMSIVGPRPLILEEDRHVVDWRRRRLHLKPGITGLWQVLGRDGIPFEEMVKLDYIYVSTWSILNDVKLILRTIPVICRPSI